MVNIFEDAKETLVPGWMKFVNDGDSVQGTYVGKIVGQKDGYGNEQVIYQLLEEDGKLTNVGFGLNKKFIVQEMDNVKFGQIVGFKYKGKVKIKDKYGKMVDVNDFALHQDPKIVNTEWLEENKDNMPEVIHVSDSESAIAAEEDFQNFENIADMQKGDPLEDDEEEEKPADKKSKEKTK
jgi:hypothetical protein